MTYRFKLNFIAPGPNDPPSNPIWRVGLHHWVTDDETPLITPLNNEQADIDQVIDSLINELEAIRGQVKRKYSNKSL